jgi:SAM-dependent methyltransferase
MDRYAQYYDLVYVDRDASKEVDFFEEVIRKFYGNRARRILDVGCGTGMHSIEFGRRCYEVVGIDISEDMINRAREKAMGVENVKFLVGDASSMELEGFDVAIAMYGVLSYFIEDESLVKFLEAVRRSLVDGGLFIFDIWNAFGIMKERLYYEMSTPNFRKSGNTLVIEEIPWKVDLINQTADLDIRWSIIDLSKGSVDIMDHKIRLRLFTPREIRYILRSCGFSVCEIYPGDVFSPFSEGSPDMTVVARAGKRS